MQEKGFTEVFGSKAQNGVAVEPARVSGSSMADPAATTEIDEAMSGWQFPPVTWVAGKAKADEGERSGGEAADPGETPEQFLRRMQSYQEQQLALAWSMWEAMANQQWHWQGYEESYYDQQWQGLGHRPKRFWQRDAMEDAQDFETQEMCDACDVLIQRMEADDLSERMEAVKDALALMDGKVFEFSRRKCSCRMVQKVIANARLAQQKEIASGLQGRARMAAIHMHANYVMQEFIQVCPPFLSVFVAKEMHGHAAKMACHRSGCRVMLRLLEAIDTDITYGQDTITLMDELLGNELGKHLMHEFAHHVISKVMERGVHRQKLLVLECFKHDLWTFATHKSSCYVLELAVSKEIDFEDDAERVQAEILEAILVSPLLVAMARNASGSNVVKAMINRPDNFGTRAVALLSENERSLQEGGKPGSRILKEMKALKSRPTDR